MVVVVMMVMVTHIGTISVVAAMVVMVLRVTGLIVVVKMVPMVGRREVGTGLPLV